MIELPEAAALAKQVSKTMAGSCVSDVEMAHSPHKFAWYNGDAESYSALLAGHTISRATSHGGMLEIAIDDACLLFCDGIRLRLLEPGESRPDKHQLLVEFTNGTVLTASVQMYGGLWCYLADTYENPYYIGARQKPSPLGAGFNMEYFLQLLAGCKPTLSCKAFLATEQRIPGLGNGVLQDILFNARLHPKRKLNTLSPADVDLLFHSVINTLNTMATQGGRDTEYDLFGTPGGYQTILCNRTKGQPCPVCRTDVEQEAYMGGKVYYCPTCQPL